MTHKIPKRCAGKIDPKVTKGEVTAIRDEARAFAATHVHALASELVEWLAAGLTPGAKLSELAAIWARGDESHAMLLAESTATRAVLDAVANEAKLATTTVSPAATDSAEKSDMQTSTTPSVQAPQRPVGWLGLLTLAVCIAAGLVWLNSGTGADVKFDANAYYALTDLDNDSVQGVARFDTEPECKDFASKQDPKEHSVCKSGVEMTKDAVNFVKVVKTPTGMLVSRGK